MVKANRPPASTESREYVREQLRQLRDSDVQHAATMLLEAGLSFVGISNDNHTIDFLFPRTSTSVRGSHIGIFLTDGGDDDLYARVYTETRGGGKVFAADASEAAQLINNPGIARTGEWNRDLEISAPITAPGFGMREIIVINPIEDWRFDIQDRNFDAE